MSRTIHNLSVEKILYRVGETIGTQKKKLIAEALGATSQGYKNWRDRNTIPWVELFEFSQKFNISLNWLLTGIENPRNPIEISTEAKEKYIFFRTIAARLNRAARQNRSVRTAAGIIQKMMEAEIIDVDEPV